MSIGKLPRTSMYSVTPFADSASSVQTREDVPFPLVRIRSEYFTGRPSGACVMTAEDSWKKPFTAWTTSRPDGIPVEEFSPTSVTGAVVSIRPPSKIRVRNLQNLGRNTVTTKILLRHGGEERKYDIVGDFLRDLGFGEGDNRDAVRPSTNPGEAESLEKVHPEGGRVCRLYVAFARSRG